MDDFIKKRIGILILVVIGALSLPLGELILALPISEFWKIYFIAVMGAVIIFGEEYVRWLFKVPPEEVPPKPPATQPQPVTP